MNLKVNKLTGYINRAGLKLKKHSPEILVGAGLIGTVAGTVMACKATLKVHEVLDEAKANLSAVEEAVELRDQGKAIYTDEEIRRDTAVIYIQTGVKLAKLYGPAIIVGGLSLASILTSHKILRTRNISLAAAYATLNGNFKEYRGNVVDRFGEKIDRELRHGIKAKQIEDVIVNEDGSEQVITKTVDVVEKKELSEYSDFARFFDNGNPHWEKDPEYNLMFLKRQERYANEKLQADRFLFLNDVYKMLGLPPSRAGQEVGWVYDENNPVGDNFVSFGIYNIHRQANRDFVNGYEPTILLDFNVDGNIMSILP